jgi:hypothetical protein
VADAVCAALESVAIRCWIAPRDVMPGRSYSGEITRAIQQCKVLVLIFSGDSNSSQQVLREVQLAANSRLHIVQFRIDPAVPNDDLEYYLSGPHWLDALTPPLQDHLERLKTSIKALLFLPGDATANKATPVAQAQEPRPTMAPSPSSPAAASVPPSNAWKWVAAAAVVLGLSYFAFNAMSSRSRSASEPAISQPIATPNEGSSPKAVPVASAPMPATSQPPLVVTQSEAENFIKGFYHDIEKDDVNKVVAYFDDTVEYYAYGRREKAFIADQLRQYFAGLPVRSFSVGEIKLQDSSAPDRTSVRFNVRYALRTAGQGTPSAGRSEVEWDLTKRQDSLKITRFNGTSYPDAAAVATP